MEACKISHPNQLGVYAYAAKLLEMIFTKASLDLTSRTVSRINECFHRQSETNLPDLQPLRNTLMLVATLKSR